MEIQKSKEIYEFNRESRKAQENQSLGKVFEESFRKSRKSADLSSRD